jgi:hypothetical protein
MAWSLEGIPESSTFKKGKWSRIPLCNDRGLLVIPTPTRITRETVYYLDLLFLLKRKEKKDKGQGSSLGADPSRFPKKITY